MGGRGAGGGKAKGGGGGGGTATPEQLAAAKAKADAASKAWNDYEAAWPASRINALSDAQANRVYDKIDRLRNAWGRAQGRYTDLQIKGVKGENLQGAEGFM